MKIKIEVDCTPQEARQFLGLPDVEPMQRAMMDHMQDQMTGAMTMLDPESLAKSWFPLGQQGIEQFQKLMFGAAKAAAAGMTQPAERPAKSEAAKPPKSEEPEPLS
jgi:hypothetical protein